MTSSVKFAKPAALRPGDPVALVAPSGPFDPESFEAGAQLLGARYRLHYGEGIRARQRYLAGSDRRRLDELVAALDDSGTKAIFCARGGYGAMRLLTGLERRARTAKPKLLVGCSDITVLHAWQQRNGIVSLHGPVLTQLPGLAPSAYQRLFSLLESPTPADALRGRRTYVSGSAEGPLVGGNLSVFTRLLGTPCLPPLAGAILLLEDVAERPYRLDRMWTHLSLAGVFREVRGIVLGSFSGCEEKDSAYTSNEVLQDLAAETGLPCAAGFPIGHGAENEPVPLGVRVRLDADGCRLTFLEAATS